MVQSDFKPEDKITLNISYNGIVKEFETEIAEVRKDCLLIKPILINEKTVGFDEKCKVNLTYVDEEKSVFQWKSIKLKNVQLKSEKYYQTKLDGEAEKLNRRSAYRLYVGETMSVTSFKNDGPKPEQVLVKDISESGFSFLSKEEYSISRVVKLNLPTPEQNIPLSAVVVRSRPDEERGITTYGCRFSESNKKLQGYIMSKQREKQNQRNGVKR